MRRVRSGKVLCGAGVVAVLFAAITHSQAQRGTPAAPAPDAVRTRVLAQVPEAPRLVIALYYPWYGLPEVSKAYRHVEQWEPEKKRIGNFVRYAASGPYDSTDPKAIVRHLRQLKGAGVDVLACSWWGQGDFTHIALRRILPLARQEGMRVCLYAEQLPGPRNRDATVSGLAAIATTLGQDPAYLKVRDRPVMFVYHRAVEQLEPEEWADALVKLEKRVPPGILAVADGNTLMNALIFDGIHLNNPALLVGATPPIAAAQQHGTVANSVVNRARKYGRVAIATVSPGFDDRKVNKPGLSISRAEGQFYRASWDAALAAKPHWVLIRSFNQWHDGTEIEPSVELGDVYLKMTAEYTARFKQGASAPPATP